MKKNVVFTLLLCMSVVSLFADEKDKRKKKSITDSIFRIEEVNVLEKKKRVELLGLDVPLHFVPMTVSTLSNQLLKRKGIVDLVDAVRFLPGIVVKPLSYGQFQQFSIRGQGSAVVMIDGIRDERTLNNNVPYGDLSAVESIELLKGPAAILAGHSAMGGVLNIVRKKATRDFSADARVSYGSWKERRATLGFGGMLLGPVEYRANIHYSTGDGWRKVNANRFSIYGALGADLRQFGRIDVSASYADDDYTTEIGAAPVMPGNMFFRSNDKPYASKGDRHPGADYREVYNDFANNYMKRKVWDLSVQYVYRLTEWMKLKERFTYFHSDLDYHCIESLSYRTSEKPLYKWYYMNKDKKMYVDLDTVQRGNAADLNPLNFNPDHKNLNNTLELTGDLRTGALWHHYTFGWVYNCFDFAQYNGYGKDDLWGPGLNVLLPVRGPKIVQGWWDTKVSTVSLRTERTHGVYLHDVIEFSPKWKVMVAGRMDFYSRKTARANVLDAKQKYDAANRTEWKEVKTSAFTYRLGAVYIPLPELSVYGSISSYFNPITRVYDPKVMYLDRKGNEFNPDEKGGEVFKPEKGYAAEMGVRYVLNEKINVNASIFYIRKNNIVKSLGDTTVTVNGVAAEKKVSGQVGRADSRGFDVEIVAHPLPSLQITSGMGWSDYRLREIAESGRFSKYKEQNKDIRATGVPRTTFYVYADYTIPRGVLKNLSFHLSGDFKDKIFRDVKNRLYYPALWLMDAGIYYTIRGHVNLALNVNNLFDKEYFERETVLGKPRNYQASVSYTF